MRAESNAGGVTLSHGDYGVLIRVPFGWWNEQTAIREIARAIDRRHADVAARITRFCRDGLVERRTRQTLTPFVEIRRIAKE